MIINNKGGYIRHFGNVTILPGKNVLNATDSDVLNAFFAANSKFKAALVPAELEIEDDKTGIQAISTARLKTYLADFNSVDDLQALLEEEQSAQTPRSSAIAMINKRIEDLKAQFNQQKDNDDE